MNKTVTMLAALSMAASVSGCLAVAQEELYISGEPSWGILYITNANKYPIDTFSVKFNGRADCVVRAIEVPKLFPDAEPAKLFAPPVPGFEVILKNTLQTGDQGRIIGVYDLPCQTIVSAEVVTDRGSVVFEFDPPMVPRRDY